MDEWHHSFPSATCWWGRDGGEFGDWEAVGAARGQKLGLVVVIWEPLFSQQLAGKGWGNVGNERKGKNQTAWIVLLDLSATIVGRPPWQLAGAKSLRKVHQEARDRNKCKASCTALEL